MEPLILNLSGRGGLADNFWGDSEMIVPQPHLRTEAEEGQMVQGLFNPYVRKGYMAPLSDTALPVSFPSPPDNNITSVVFDDVSNKTFVAEKGNKIYEADSFLDNSFQSVIELESGVLIDDLEIYNINSERKLFYVYSSANVRFERALSRRALWSTYTIDVEPSGPLTPRIIAKHVETSSVNPTIFDVEVPAGFTDVTMIVYFFTGSSVPNVNIDSAAATEVTQDTFIARSNRNFGVYYMTGITSGTHEVELTVGSLSNIHVLVVDNSNQTTPITNVNLLKGTTSTASFDYESRDGVLQLGFVGVGQISGELSQAGTPFDVDITTQTEAEGQSVAFSADGTKMYADGGSTRRLFQYTLSTPWDITTESYDSVSFDYTPVLGNVSIRNIFFKPDGTRMYLGGESGDPSVSSLQVWNLSTPWDLTTATHDSDLEFSSSMHFTGFTSVWGYLISKDGKHLYISGSVSNLFPTIVQYELTTPWDPSSAQFVKQREFRQEIGGSNVGTIAFGMEEKVMYIDRFSRMYAFNFDPRRPYDVEGLTLAVSSDGQPESRTHPSSTTPAGQITMSPDSRYMFYRFEVGGTNVKVGGFEMDLGLVPSIVSTSGIETEGYQGLSIDSQSRVLRAIRGIECGIASLPSADVREDNWLTDRTGTFVNSTTDYNFIRTADNGFAYLFTGNRVHKIDGDITGGNEGTVTRDVLILPAYFTISDALDYRGNLYIAIQQYGVETGVVDSTMFTGRAGILVWDRLSYQLGGTDYVDIPGVREIKRIYASPDGMIKLIVISDSGITEVRQFGYNDSGGVVFRNMKTLGQGAEPQYPDGLTITDDKAVWIANDGYVYSELEGRITKLHQIKAPGNTTEGKKENISSGVILYGGQCNLPQQGLRCNRESFLVTYRDSTTEAVRIFPFGFINSEGDANGSLQGDVYTKVEHIPPKSVVRRIRVYNAPTESTGDTVAATVKIYFNQSSTPNITKDITFDEAKRGYVDFSINKPYLNSVQLEFEWNEAIDMGPDTYLPSVGIITVDPDTTKSPDNG